MLSGLLFNAPRAIEKTLNKNIVLLYFQRWERLWGHWMSWWGRLGVSRGSFGRTWVTGGSLGDPWGSLGDPGVPGRSLGNTWEVLGRSWGSLGGTLEILGVLGGSLGDAQEVSRCPWAAKT